jgi:hypothetical protein
VLLTVSLVRGRFCCWSPGNPYGTIVTGDGRSLYDGFRHASDHYLFEPGATAASHHDVIDTTALHVFEALLGGRARFDDRLNPTVARRGFLAVGLEGPLGGLSSLPLFVLRAVVIEPLGGHVVEDGDRVEGVEERDRCSRNRLEDVSTGTRTC